MHGKHRDTAKPVQCSGSTELLQSTGATRSNQQAAGKHRDNPHGMHRGCCNAQEAPSCCKVLMQCTESTELPGNEPMQSTGAGAMHREHPASCIGACCDACSTPGCPGPPKPGAKRGRASPASGARPAGCRCKARGACNPQRAMLSTMQNPRSDAKPPNPPPKPAAGPRTEPPRPPPSARGRAQEHPQPLTGSMRGMTAR